MNKKAGIPNAGDVIVHPAEFQELVRMIESARERAWNAVNAELVGLYWEIGKWLCVRCADAKWGDKVINATAEYLSANFPNAKGFSRPGLYRMRQFYELYKDDEIVSPLVRQITWTNHLIIMARSRAPEERRFYVEKCISEHYSKRQLERQFDSGFYERCQLGKVAPASRKVVPAAREAIRDLYSLEFMDLPQKHVEKDLRHAIVAQMKDFILELGRDFTFAGQEYPVKVGMSDFSIDLLFFNRALNCFVAFELKTRQFRPSDIGQIDFYLEALDRDVKKPTENPSVGVVLCTDKDDAVVEYALSRSLSPTMVATYQFALPDKNLLANRLRQITELTLEAAGVSELPEDEA